VSSPSWEIQKVLVAQLKADTTFMGLISNRIYDEPETNLQYPYVVVGDAVENKWNDLSHNGFETYFSFHIYTKPSGLGFYQAKQIESAIDKILNMKKFALTGYTMVICQFDNAISDRENDIRIISVRYKILTDSDTLITF